MRRPLGGMFRKSAFKSQTDLTFFSLPFHSVNTGLMYARNSIIKTTLNKHITEHQRKKESEKKHTDAMSKRNIAKRVSTHIENCNMYT